MTLILAGNSDGALGWCDAKCHDATEPGCHCICGGLFHGKGSGSPVLREVVEKRGDEVLVSLRALKRFNSSLKAMLLSGVSSSAASGARHAAGTCESFSQLPATLFLWR